MVHVISVTAAEGGWSVRSSGADNEMMFLSGAKAELAARRLGDKLSKQGHTAEIRIYLRDGSLAGRFLCAPAAEMALAG